MTVTMVGTGYVGLVTGVALAELGNTVICADVDEKKIDMLNNGETPIYEPGLKDLLARNIKEGRISFTTDTKSAIKKSDLVFSAVGTPMGENHEADLTYVRQVAKTFAESLNGYKVLVTKSTVPVGTGEMVKKIIKEYTDKEFDVASNPEFLREGNAVKDFMVPDRIVVGTESKKAAKLLKELYAPLIRTDHPYIETDIKSAELIKYAANSMLATRISFMNEISRYADAVGANVKEVSKGIGLDDRIGPRFLSAGIGYGGSCFPKDVQALIESGKDAGYDFRILNAVEEVNFDQRKVFVEKVLKGVKKGDKVAVWGLAFKPKTDDVRAAPSKDIIESLIEAGVTVSAFDPVAIEKFKEEYPDMDIEYAEDKYEALENADALLLLTEWDEFRTLDFEKLKAMKGKAVYDGRNIYEPQKLEKAGYQHTGLGIN